MSSTYHYDKMFKAALAKLDEAKITAEDRALVKRFIERLNAQGVSEGHLADYIFKLKVICELLGVAFTEAKREDIERTLVKIRNEHRPSTYNGYALTIKRFFKFVKSGELDRETPYPDEVKWIRADRKLNRARKPEFLTPNEVQRMIAAADKIRDKAMLAVGFEAGLRASELLGINIGDVSFDNIGARVRIRGKTGERIVRLITSVPLLTRHLETHRFRNDPNAPLWLSEARNFNNRLSWAGWNMKLKELAEKAGIKGKHIHNHLLRHGSATEAAKYLSDEELKIRYGWVGGSNMPAVYVHLSGGDLDQKLSALLSGGEMKPPEPEFKPVICPRCHERNTPGIRYCGKCGTPLDPRDIMQSSVEVEELKRKVDGILEMLKGLLSASQGAR